MNVIGHPYVATKVVGRLTEDLIIGSFIPDIVPFVPNTVFQFEEIHEGGEHFLKFLDDTCPQKRDLALGMLCHGAKFGADQFSRYIENRFARERDILAKRIADASKVSLETARQSRFRNLLWWGMDVQLIWNEPIFVKDLARKLAKVDTLGTANLLAECFGKDPQKVLRDIKFLESSIKPQNLYSARGLATIWKGISAGLPENDQIDVGETEKIFEDCAQLLEKDWKQLVEQIIAKVGKNLKTAGFIP